MATIPQDVADKLKLFAETLGKDEEEIIQEFKEVLEQDYMLEIEDESERAMEALFILSARLKNRMTGRPTKAYETIILSKIPPRQIRPPEKDPFYLAVWWVLAVEKDNPTAPVMVGEIRMYDAATKNFGAVEEGLAYEINCSGQEKNNLWQLNLPDQPTIKKIEKDFGSVKDILEKMFKKVKISEAEFNLTSRDASNKMILSDKRLLEGRVVRRWQATRKDGKPIAGYNIEDPSIMAFTEDSKDSTLTVFVSDLAWVEPPHNYITGSKLMFLGTLSQNQETKEVTMNGDFLLPIRPIREKKSENTNGGRIFGDGEKKEKIDYSKY